MEKKQAQVHKKKLNNWKMYNNVGKTMKSLAQVLTIVECVCWLAIAVLVSIIGGVYLALQFSAGLSLLGFVLLPLFFLLLPVICLIPCTLVAAVCCFFVWMANLPLYGFGELIDIVGKIKINTDRLTEHAPVAESTVSG